MRHVKLDKTNLRILDLEEPVLNSTVLDNGRAINNFKNLNDDENGQKRKKGNQTGYPPYTLNELVILCAYHIMQKKRQNTTRLIVIPINDNYREYQFQQMLALKDFITY